MIYDSFLLKQKKQLALLIDPDKHTTESLQSISALAQQHQVDYIFVGGSLLITNMYDAISTIKLSFTGPVILFPGNANQVASNADAILFLSLISGRNPEFLIGNHVVSAHSIKKAKLEVISTGYMLIDCGNTTSVEYISNTRPIPSTKPDIAVATALAGEMLGMRAIYLEGGSGAQTIVSPQIITGVSKTCTIPIIVGGGIRTPELLKTVFDAGANIAVVGTIIEKDSSILPQMMDVVRKENS